MEGTNWHNFLTFFLLLNEIGCSLIFRRKMVYSLERWYQYHFGESMDVRKKTLNHRVDIIESRYPRKIHPIFLYNVRPGVT